MHKQITNLELSSSNTFLDYYYSRQSSKSTNRSNLVLKNFINESFIQSSQKLKSFGKIKSEEPSNSKESIGYFARQRQRDNKGNEGNEKSKICINDGRIEDEKCNEENYSTSNKARNDQIDSQNTIMCMKENDCHCFHIECYDNNDFARAMNIHEELKDNSNIVTNDKSNHYMNDDNDDYHFRYQPLGNNSLPFTLSSLFESYNYESFGYNDTNLKDNGNDDNNNNDYCNLSNLLFNTNNILSISDSKGIKSNEPKQETKSKIKCYCQIEQTPFSIDDSRYQCNITH